MTRFGRYLASILDKGAHEASKDGSATVEAQHLLLAIAGDEEPSTREILSTAGIDYSVIREALDREFEQSLAAAGVSLAAFVLPQPSKSEARHPQPGESVKLAIERCVASVARKADMRPAHLLLGILHARVGTVPRALALAGIDQSTLTARVRQTLADDPDD